LTNSFIEKDSFVSFCTKGIQARLAKFDSSRIT